MFIEFFFISFVSFNYCLGVLEKLLFISERIVVALVFAYHAHIVCILSRLFWMMKWDRIRKWLVSHKTFNSNSLGCRVWAIENYFTEKFPLSLIFVPFALSLSLSLSVYLSINLSIYTFSSFLRSYISFYDMNTENGCQNLKNTI